MNVRYVLKNPDTAKLKTGSQNSKKRKTQFSNTEGEGVEQKYSINSETTRQLILVESWERRSFREYQKDCVVKHE